MKGWKVEYNECEWIVCVAPDAVTAVAVAEEEYTRFVGMSSEQMAFQNGDDFEQPEVTRVPVLDGLESFTEEDLWDRKLVSWFDGDEPDTGLVTAMFLSTEG